MFEQYAKVDNMSCLLSENKNAETLPEPFRMQRHVIFRVTYSEYIDYVLSLTPDSGVKLMADLGTLATMAATHHPRLYNCFLQDMAFAILKELSFAEQYKQCATVILPASFNQNNISYSSLLAAYETSRCVQNELLIYMNEQGFGIPNKVSEYNLPVLQTAVVLFFLSKKDDVKEVNIVYATQ